MATVDILILTYNHPSALAIYDRESYFPNLSRLSPDQTEDFDAGSIAEVQSVLRVLRSRGHPIEIHKHLPRQGMAEHRQFLLDQVTAPYALFLDDDLILESCVVQQTLTAIQEESCGLIPSGVYHQELETTIHDRTINAPVVLSLLPS
ncbi:glycosyltransferase family A protein [Phormidesmis priestleyi]|uniref:glycosyltransferase family A protein n=1 Tax=Phormidesmis priestleyi TaxID=268141 RepID=UPI000839E80E|nr:glycosyltransferase family A protein [Phormidesmis priestleyi]